MSKILAFEPKGWPCIPTTTCREFDTQHRIAVALTMTQLFSFQGRINRAQFWLGLLIYFLISLALYTASDLLYAMSQRPDHSTFSVVVAFVFIPFALIGLFVAFFWILTVGTKRLHDRAKSGTWMIAFLLPPWVLDLASEFVDRSGSASEHWIWLGLSTASNAFLVWGLVELGLMRGMTGVNQYGEDPLAPSHNGRPGRYD